MTAVLSTGVAIFATYAGCDPVLLGEIKKSDEIVPYFVMHELYFIPGMKLLWNTFVLVLPLPATDYAALHAGHLRSR